MCMIEIIAVGDELLSGRTVNTNASLISRRLFEEGFQIGRHSVLPDDPKMLREGFFEAFERSPVVIASGGLGPTLDDHTREVAADLFGVKLEFNSELKEKLSSRFGDIPSLDDQATVPTGATLLDNPLGSASGIVLEDGKKTLILIPGVPHEMKEMLMKEVIPFLCSRFQVEKKEKVASLHLSGIFEAEVDPVLRVLKEKFPKTNFGIYPRLGLLTVLVKEDLSPLAELKEAFQKHVFDSPSGKIEEAVQLKMIEKRLTLSCAESCTGGALASRITSLPGASEYFLGSIVSYSNHLKESALGVSHKTLLNHGAVSEEVAKEMALGALKISGSDYTLAVTGVAGPDGGTDGKPVGTVWMAVGKKGEEPKTFLHKGFGTREMVIQFSVNRLLSTLYRKI